MPVQGPSTPYPTNEAAPTGKNENVELGAGAEAATEVKEANATGAPAKAKDDFSADGGPQPKYERPQAPPGYDPAEFNKKMELAESVMQSLGAAGHAALAETVDSIKSNPEVMADPQKFFAALEQTMQKQLTERGVAIPPQGFDKLEQISTLVTQSTEAGANAGGVGETAANVGSSSTTLYGQTAEILPTTNYAILGSMPEGDIEALAFLVLMQAAKSAQEDVRGVMASVKAINATKAQLRETLQKRQKLAGQPEVAKLTASQHTGALNDTSKGGGAQPGYKPNLSPDNKEGYTKMANYYPAPETKKALDNQIDQIKSDIDSMSEMGEMESLRLQMAMDRMSKMMSTLSNLLKKISDTASQITQNFK